MENVWDYPRPPRVERCGSEVVIVHGGRELARSREAWRVLETSHPPAIYIPQADIEMSRLRANGRQSFCEFKGMAGYWDLDGEIGSVAWSYARPTPGFEEIAGCLAFYPSRVEQCRLGEEVVQAQAGDFYGGWITSDLQGPFKGGPGTAGW